MQNQSRMSDSLVFKCYHKHRYPDYELMTYDYVLKCNKNRYAMRTCVCSEQFILI